MVMCNDNYSLYEVQCVPGIKQKFKYFCRYADISDEMVYDLGFYITIDDTDKTKRFELIERIIRTIEKNKYANKIPQDIVVYSRFVTKIAIRYDLFKTVVGEFLEVVKTCNISDNDSSKPYIKALCDAFMKVSEKHIETNVLDTSYLMFDVYDYNVCSSYVGLFNDVGYPMMTSCELVEKISREDINISFSEKASGVISASFRPVPMCIGDIIFRPLDNFFMNVTNDKINISYIGTIHDVEKYKDFSHFKADLTLTFVPQVTEDNKIFKNLNQFEKFNDFIEYISNGTETSTPLTDMKIPVRLDEIYVRCTGELNDKEHTASKIIEKLIYTICTDKTYNIVDTDENSITVQFDDSKCALFDVSRSFTIRPVMY